MDIFNEFEETYGAKSWPSDDPEDTPFNRFKCKHCGKVFSIQMFGACSIDGPTFKEVAKIKLRKHLLTHCSDSFLKNLLKEISISEQGYRSSIIDLLLLREISK